MRSRTVLSRRRATAGLDSQRPLVAVESHARYVDASAEGQRAEPLNDAHWKGPEERLYDIINIIS